MKFLHVLDPKPIFSGWWIFSTKFHNIWFKGGKALSLASQRKQGPFPSKARTLFQGADNLCSPIETCDTHTKYKKVVILCLERVHNPKQVRVALWTEHASFWFAFSSVIIKLVSFLLQKHLGILLLMVIFHSETSLDRSVPVASSRACEQ